jgi:AcrR family transcriptional regulator
MRTYRAGQPIDMSALASELGIGRATLYRWVGNREALMSAVLAIGTEQTFRAAVKDAEGEGVTLIVDAMRRFMTSVVTNPALVALTQREPLLFVRLATMPGPIEARAAELVSGLLMQEEAAGRLALALPADVLAQAIIRLTDAHLYAHLLGRKDPEIQTELELVALLLGGQPEQARQ